MSETSPILSLPYIAPAQAQKHVTHNEAVEALDVLVQLVVKGFDRTIPPAAPVAGEVHALGKGATAAWQGHDGEIAAFLGGGWRFFLPQDGWIATEAATGALRVRQGGAWVGQSFDSVAMLGVNTGPDASNRLAVASDAVLLTHAGADHRLKLNKAGPAATASLLFQSDWSGRAEMGLAGEDSWSIKVSADGGTWITALRIDAATGQAGGAAVQQTPADATPGRLMRADYGYGPATVLGPVGFADDVPSGAVIETGSEAGGAYTRFADGTQICTGSFLQFGVPLSTPRAGGFQGALPPVAFAAPFAGPPVASILLDETIEALAKGAEVEAGRMAPLVWSAAAGSVDISGRYLAVGRWA